MTFVDDLRTIGACFALVQCATHRVETMMGYLGLQDATRKRRPNSKASSHEAAGFYARVHSAKVDESGVEEECYKGC